MPDLLHQTSNSLGIVNVFCLSVSQPFKGDYLEISKNPKYQKLSSAMDEKVLLADVVNKINRANGKVRKVTHTMFTIHLAFVRAEKSKIKPVIML